jgi:hypothetical protein
MCNLYAITTNQAATIAPFRAMNKRAVVHDFPPRECPLCVADSDIRSETYSFRNSREPESLGKLFDKFRLQDTRRDMRNSGSMVSVIRL